MNCYIHIPFCFSKCGYCAFYSETGASSGKIDSYLAALEKVMVPEKLSTLYIGGGTPTLLDCSQLERLISILEEKFTVDNQYSIEHFTVGGELVKSVLVYNEYISNACRVFDTVNSDRARALGE